jgi:ribosomal protein S20
MPKITDEPLVAIQLRIYKTDLEKLRRQYGSEFGVNKTIRSIIRTFIKQVEAKANEEIDRKETALPPLSEDFMRVLKAEPIADNIQ